MRCCCALWELLRRLAKSSEIKLIARIAMEVLAPHSISVARATPIAATGVLRRISVSETKPIATIVMAVQAHTSVLETKATQTTATVLAALRSASEISCTSTEATALQKTARRLEVRSIAIDCPLRGGIEGEVGEQTGEQIMILKLET